MNYAYIHCKPDDSIFYVGKGTLSRAKNVNAKRNQHHKRVVEKYGKDNIRVGIIECSSETIAFELEKGLIKCLKAANVKLTNMTSGGEGNAGRIHSAEEKEKRRLSIIGKKRSIETRRKQSISATGKVCSEETKKKLRDIFLDRPLHSNFLAAQKGRCGKENPHAKVIYGFHPEEKYMKFDTLTQAAKYVNGSVSKVCKSAKTGTKHKGWRFYYNVPEGME